MKRDWYVRVTLGTLLGLGGLGIIVGTVTNAEGYVSGFAAIVCMLSAAAAVYTNKRDENGTDD